MSAKTSHSPPRSVAASPRSAVRPSSGVVQAIAFSLAVFVAIVVRQFDTIESPPTKDQTLGIWMEANYLAESHFDYRGLIHQEGELGGGPRLYVISILPSLLAALMVATGSAQATIIGYHLFTYACATMIALLVFVAVRSFAGATGAVLVCLALLTTPMFSAQVSLCGMEIPLAMFVMLAAMSVWRRHFVLAAICAMLAFFTKFSGTLVTVAILAYLILQWVAVSWDGESPTRPAKRQIVQGFIVNGCAFMAQMAIVVSAPIGLGNA